MIKAVIFDMDGLMFDTETLAVDAWSHAGREMELDIPRNIVIKTCGLNAENSKRVFFEYLGKDFDFYTCREVKLGYMTKYISDNGVPVKPGLIELLEFLKANDYRMTIATSTKKERAEYYLKTAGVLKYFDKAVFGDMIERGKPEPDIYLKAIEILGANPHECIALEDSPAGIEAAYRAGINPVMIPDLIEPDEQTSRMLYAKLPGLLDVIDLLNHQDK